MDSAREQTSKKPYESPSLVTYGDIREITQALNGSGKNDHATQGPNKT
jgi:hypothetical protein